MQIKNVVYQTPSFGDAKRCIRELKDNGDTTEYKITMHVVSHRTNEYREVVPQFTYTVYEPEA